MKGYRGYERQVLAVYFRGHVYVSLCRDSHSVGQGVTVDLSPRVFVHTLDVQGFSETGRGLVVKFRGPFSVQGLCKSMTGPGYEL